MFFLHTSDVKLVIYYHLNCPYSALGNKVIGVIDALNLVSNLVAQFLTTLKTELKWFPQFIYSKQRKLVYSRPKGLRLWSRDPINSVPLQGEWSPSGVLWPVKAFILPPAVVAGKGNCILRCALHYKGGIMSIAWSMQLPWTQRLLCALTREWTVEACPISFLNSPLDLS